jgi:hypothetical protein
MQNRREIQLLSKLKDTLKSPMTYSKFKNEPSHTIVKGLPENEDTSFMYALKRRKEAKGPIANPFVVAFAVFPTPSSKSIISLTLSGCWLISTIFLFSKHASL